MNALRQSVAQAPAIAYAWYNLADVQDARGESEGAIRSLVKAVEIAPSFADAHFNLAASLEKAGHIKEASRYWRAYLKLDSNSQWAGVARRRLAAR